MRVLATHAYSMKEARRRCEEGDLPRQQLWGCDALERLGHEVEYGPFGDSPALRTLTRKTRSQLGYLDEELGMWRRRDRGAVMYAGGPDITRGLAYLRRARARLRLASVFHTVRPATRGDAFWIKSIDLAVTLSHRGGRRLVEQHGRDPARTVTLPWGPDLGFPLYRPTGDELVVSAGQTNRDISTLLTALTRLRAPARVYVPPGSPFSSTGDVEIVHIDPAGFHGVLHDLRRASIVAIPLVDVERVSGITELNDALGLGKPLVVTRSPEIDVDVEAVGCGREVAPGDVEGWVSALEELLGDAELRRRMGERGRDWARDHWNSDLFGERLAAALEDAFGSAK